MEGMYEVRRGDKLRCQTASGIEKLMGRIHRQHGDLISLFLYFQNKESGLKTDNSRMNRSAEKSPGGEDSMCSAT
jgi:hypothetical protein